MTPETLRIAVAIGAALCTSMSAPVSWHGGKNDDFLMMILGKIFSLIGIFGLFSLVQL